MDLGVKLRQSFRQLLRNPSLLGIAVAELVLVYLLLLLFYLVDLRVMGALLTDALTGDIGLSAQQSATASVVLIALVLLQAFILLLVDSFFKAGLYGMIKNLFQDGSTGIREFGPEARQFWAPMFWFLLMRYVLMSIAVLPLIIGATLAGSAGSAIGMLAVLLLWFAVFLLLLFGEPTIVFEKEAALPALRRSVALVRKNAVLSLLVVIIAVALMVGVALLEMLVAMPVEQRFPAVPEPGDPWIITRGLIGILFAFIMTAITVVIAIYAFHAYRSVTGGRPAAGELKGPRRKARRSA